LMITPLKSKSIAFTLLVILSLFLTSPSVMP
jgi:hypothetical protein